MINEYDVLAMMQDGDTEEVVAQKLADALNKGKVLYAEEVEKRKAYEAKHAAERRAVMVEEVQGMIDQFYDFCYRFYTETDEEAEELTEIFKSFDASAILDAIETAGAAVKSLGDFTGFVLDGKPNISFKIVEPAKTETKVKAKTVDETIHDFLSALGL